MAEGDTERYSASMADRGKAMKCHELPPGLNAEYIVAAKNAVNRTVAEHRRALAVGPDDALEIR